MGNAVNGALLCRWKRLVLRVFGVGAVAGAVINAVVAFLAN